MTILLDQNIPRSVHKWLTNEKPEWVIHLASDLGLSHSSDQEIFSNALARKAVIITYDKDFTDIRLSLTPISGIIRLKDFSA